jgi:putative NADH-flavin reductase
MRSDARHLTVFGATGATGTEIVRAALAGGHTVTAVARDPSKLEIDHDRLRIVRGDVLDAASIEAATCGADAVISALGVGSERTPTTVYSTGVRNILDAMRTSGVRRFVGISALPVTPRDEVGLIHRRLLFPILRRFFGESYADMARMEQLLGASGVAWTVLRPPRLTDGPGTGRYRTAVGAPLPRAGRISRADLARVMLQVLDDPRAQRAAIAVAY